MSRSPRRRLQTAAETLDALVARCERYPDAREEVTRALGGPERFATAQEARRILQTGAAAVGSPASPLADEAGRSPGE